MGRDTETHVIDFAGVQAACIGLYTYGLVCAGHTWLLGSRVGVELHAVSIHDGLGRSID